MTLDINAIRERANKATKGPWEFTGVDVYSDVAMGRAKCVAAHPPYGKKLFARDGTFIAHARTDIPALCDEVERLRTLLQEAIDNDEYEYGKCKSDLPERPCGCFQSRAKRAIAACQPEEKP